MEDTVHPFKGLVQGFCISDISLDELSAWAQLPLGSAEVEQDDRNAALS